MKALLTALCLLCAFTAQAEVYKWIDKDGVVHYSDTKPQDETLEVKEFLGSPIKINDKGLVVQANQDSVPKAAPQPARKTETTLASLLADAKEFFYGLFAGKQQPLPEKKLTPKPVVTKPPSSSEDTVVISNDNMGEMLDQIAKEKQARQEKEDALANPSVEIFTTPWCGYCKKAIVYLELNKIPYTEYDVSANPAAALRQQMLGGSGGVPFAVVNGEKIRGWNKQAYASALGL